MAVASAGPYASLHLVPDRWLCQQPPLRFLFFTDRIPSCCQTNSIKALKAYLCISATVSLKKFLWVVSSALLLAFTVCHCAVCLDKEATHSRSCDWPSSLSWTYSWYFAQELRHWMFPVHFRYHRAFGRVVVLGSVRPSTSFSADTDTPIFCP